MHRDAGWHADPNGVYEYRYWDGSTWTDNVSDGGSIKTAKLLPPPPPSGRPAVGEASSQRAIPVAAWAAFGAAIAMVVGALGPWREALGGVVSVSGTANGGDGVYVIGMALVYAALIALWVSNPRTWKAVLAALVALAVAGTAVADYGTLKDGVADQWRDTVSAGWGIWLAGIAGAVGIVLTWVLPAPKSQV
jgi:hypothetical protein